jgi:sulfur-oxidizing protein SoxZ
MARALITMPKTAKAGEVIEIRTLIAHPMETGYRPGENGAILPRNLIRRLTCRYFDGHDDALVFSADLYPAIAANPYIAFFTTATATGVLRFSWEGDDGFTQTESVNITVT